MKSSITESILKIPFCFYINSWYDLLEIKFLVLDRFFFYQLNLVLFFLMILQVGEINRYIFLDRTSSFLAFFFLHLSDVFFQHHTCLMFSFNFLFFFSCFSAVRGKALDSARYCEIFSVNVKGYQNDTLIFSVQ